MVTVITPKFIVKLKKLKNYVRFRSSGRRFTIHSIRRWNIGKLLAWPFKLWLTLGCSTAMDCHVERAEFSSSVVNLSYWKPGSTGAALLFLFKQAITPLHHFHQEKGKISPSCEFQEEILETGKSLRQEVIKTAPSSGNKKRWFARDPKEQNCFF